MSKFESGKSLAPHLGAAKRQQLTSPFRQPTPRSDWGTPLLQAATLSFLVAILAGGAVGAISNNWLAALKVFVGAFFLICTVMFWSLMNRSYRSIFHTLNHEPYRPPEDVRPIVSSSKGTYTNPEEAPATVKDADPETIAKCPYPTKTMRWFVWWAERKGTGYEVWEKALGRRRYTAWRNALISAGWAEWKSYGPNGKPATKQGWHLRASADAICERIQQ